MRQDAYDWPFIENEYTPCSQNCMTIFVRFHGVWSLAFCFTLCLLFMPHCYIYRTIKLYPCPALGFHSITQVSLLNAYRVKFIHKVRVLKLCPLICPPPPKKIYINFSSIGDVTVGTRLKCNCEFEPVMLDTVLSGRFKSQMNSTPIPRNWQWGLKTKLYHKRDDLNFHAIFNFPFMSICSKIPPAPVYGVYFSQLIRYSRACCFLDRVEVSVSRMARGKTVSSHFRSSFKACSHFAPVEGSCYRTRNLYWTIDS